MQPQDVNKQAGVLPAQTEMPQHYTYLKEFRVEQCQQFQQHKCNQHKPFTCFHWHFQNQRRRRPIRRRDGTFNYSPDAYCTKYDETSGVCPDGDDCPFLHRVAGDVERRYHLRYYKTAACCHDTDSKGMCTKNGAHCAFAHGRNDLRPPVLDVREMQAEKEYAENGLPPPNILDRERNVMTEDPKWQEAGFVLSNYKTEPCKKPPRLCRQGYACPQYHNNKDKRRSPRKHKYRSTPCPIVKSGDEWGDPTLCDAGDSCQYCHTRTEQQFHPEIYKSTRCHDMQQTGCCPRGPFCAFAHLDHEISLARELQAACESGTSLGELLSTALSTNGGKGPEVGGHFSQGSGGAMQRQTSEQDGLKRSQPVEMNANSSPTSSYLSSSLPNRQPLVGSGMMAKTAVGGVSTQQQEEHVLPPGLGPRSYSIGNRAVPTTSASLASRKPGIGDSSPLISIPTNFMDTLLPSIPPSKQASDGASDALSGQNRQNGGQLGTSFDAIFQDFTAPVGSYSKAPGSEKEATRRRQLSAKDGAFMIGSLDSSSDHGLSYGNLMSRGVGFVGSPFAQAPGSQFFAGDGLSGQLDDLHLDDPFFGITGHPLDFDEPPKPGSSSLGGLSFSRSSAPVSIPSSTSGMVSSVRWPSESPTSTSLSTQGMMSIGSAGNSFNLAVGSPSVSLPPGFNRQQMLQQQQMQQIGSGRNRAESGAMADQMMSQSPSFKFGSFPVSIAGTPQSLEQENFRLKEENASYRSKMVSWEETVVQARKAYEAWKGEVEAAKSLAQSEKQQKEEAQTRVHLLQKEIEQLMQTHGSQNNNNNNLLNALASVNRLPLQELRVVQAQLVRELEKVTKVIQETEAKMAK